MCAETGKRFDGPERASHARTSAIRQPELRGTMAIMNATDDFSTRRPGSARHTDGAPVLRTHSRALPVVAALMFALAALQLSDAFAQPAYQLAQAPLPPSRPAHLDQRKSSQPEPEAPAAPVTPIPRAVSRTPAGDSARVPAPAEAPFHPMTEPGPMTHRRAAVRACSEEWQKLKKTGAAGLRVWRDFSMECLTRKK